MNEGRVAALRAYHAGRWQERLDDEGRLRCTKCGEAHAIGEYRTRAGRPTGFCQACRRAMPSNEPDVRRASRLLGRYGITVADYDAMLDAQGGVCGICGGPPNGISKAGRFYIDHDHDTDEVRGLLCSQCNLLLGAARDSIPNLMAAIAYLGRTKGEG